MLWAVAHASDRASKEIVFISNILSELHLPVHGFLVLTIALLSKSLNNWVCPNLLNTLHLLHIGFVKKWSTKDVGAGMWIDEIMPETLFSKLVMHRQDGAHDGVPGG